MLGRTLNLHRLVRVKEEGIVNRSRKKQEDRTVKILRVLSKSEFSHSLSPIN